MTIKKKIAIMQSNYIPWKGYFDILNYVDEIIIYDDVQYTRRDWRNRNIIKTQNDLKWLTIPINTKGKYFQNICDTKIDNHAWIDKHLNSIRHSYKRASYFHQEFELLIKMYNQARKLKYLSDVNLLFIKGICDHLDISTHITYSMDYEFDGDKTQKLISLCEQANAGEYITGPAAKSYINEKQFSENGINLKYFNYNGYKEYPQLFDGFVHNVSIIDVLLNTGRDAYLYMKK